jgi:hypothetical protein
MRRLGIFRLMGGILTFDDRGDDLLGCEGLCH